MTSRAASIRMEAWSQEVDDDKHNVCRKNAERDDGYYVTA